MKSLKITLLGLLLLAPLLLAIYIPMNSQCNYKETLTETQKDLCVKIYNK